MKLYTQITKPKGLTSDSLWLPGLQTETIPHRKAWKQSLLLTHIEPLKHYDYDIVELLDERIHCIGPKTYDRLVEMGFTRVEMHGLVAEDIKINSHPLTPCTWLHGDKYARDFGHYTGVTAIQTYKSSLNETSLGKILTEELPSLSEIYVYSNRVLEALETRSNFSKVTLHHTETCTPNQNRWAETKSFYPGSEFD